MLLDADTLEFAPLARSSSLCRLPESLRRRPRDRIARGRRRCPLGRLHARPAEHRCLIRTDVLALRDRLRERGFRAGPAGMPRCGHAPPAPAGDWPLPPCRRARALHAGPGMLRERGECANADATTRRTHEPVASRECLRPATVVHVSGCREGWFLSGGVRRSRRSRQQVGTRLDWSIRESAAVPYNRRRPWPGRALRLATGARRGLSTDPQRRARRPVRRPQHARSRVALLRAVRPHDPRGTGNHAHSWKRGTCGLKDDAMMLYQHCPRCRLAIHCRASFLALENCPRCLGRAGMVTAMFTSPLNALELRAAEADSGSQPAFPVHAVRRVTSSTRAVAGPARD